MTLYDYGIQNEKSDLRAHVSVVGKCVYIYQTSNGIKAIKTGQYIKVPAYTGTIRTALGFIVPPFDIDGIRVVEVPDRFMRAAAFLERDTTSAKGDKAVKVVKALLCDGMFPMNAAPEIVEDRQMQISGLDIIVKMEIHIQVKCDWKCGMGDGCTGNLFLQVAESNPFKMH